MHSIIDGAEDPLLMFFNKIIRIVEHPARADQSAPTIEPDDFVKVH